jgi:hypothetical protein
MVTVSDGSEWLSLRDDQGMSMTANKGSSSSVLVRIERAKAHLADFDRQAKLISAACEVTRECDERSSEYVFRLSNLPTVPAVLSAIIGDAIHNLRVSLDYLAWQLVIATGKKPPNKYTYFPVRDERPDADRTGLALPKIEPGVSKEVREILDQVQPYKVTKPKNHDLAVLHALDINDKHHELLVTIVGVKDNMMAWWGDAEPTWFNAGPYSEGSEICRFRYSGTNQNRDFGPTLRFDVRLGESDAGMWGQMLGAADLVRRPLSYIENEVLPRLQGFLGS